MAIAAPSYLRVARLRTAAFLLIAFAFWCFSGTDSTARAEQWTSLSTNKTTQAAFLGMWQDNVVLRLTDGRRVVVPKNQLTAASRLQADELAAKKAEVLQTRIDELSAGPATEAIASVEPAAAYNPLPDSVSLKDFVEAAGKELEAGHLRTLWDSLPKSYQNDVKDLMRLTNETTDKEQYVMNQRLAAQLGRTLLKQRDFAFNYPAMDSVPPEAMGIIEKVYSPVAGIVSILGDQDVLSLEAIRADDWEPMIAELDQKLAPHLAALLRVVPIEYNPLASLTNLNPDAVQMNGDARGTVTITGPDGKNADLAFVLMDGKWLPEPMVADWSESMAEAKKQVTATASQAQQSAAASSAAISFVGAALGNIESAETQEEFNEIIDMYIGTVMQMIGPQMAANGQAQAGPGMGRGGPGMVGPGMVGPGMGAPGDGKAGDGPGLEGHDG